MLAATLVPQYCAWLHPPNTSRLPCAQILRQAQTKIRTTRTPTPRQNAAVDGSFVARLLVTKTDAPAPSSHGAPPRPTKFKSRPNTPSMRQQRRTPPHDEASQGQGRGCLASSSTAPNGPSMR